LNTNYSRLIKMSCAALLLCGGATASQAADWQWQGFIAQGLIQTTDDSFVAFDDDISTNLTELGLNSSIRLAPAWRVAAQVVYLDSGNRYPHGGRLDYLFVDWNFYSSLDWQANLYLGRFKNQHWLYSAIRDVPFTRPSIVLPQSVYFDAFRDIAVSSDGLAIQARHSNSYGDLTVNWSYGVTPISNQQHKMLLGRNVNGKLRQDHDHKASLYWQPNLSRFSIGVSLIDTEFTYDKQLEQIFNDADFTVQRVMFHLRYQQEFWELALELQQERVKTAGFFAANFDQNQFGQGGYLLLQYRPAVNWRLFSFADYSVNNKDDRHGRQLEIDSAGQISDYFAYQHTFATGVNYDFTSALSLSAEVHWVKGVGRLSPVIVPDIANNPAEYWQLYALQLMYRF
jgi:hypothetical protein